LIFKLFGVLNKRSLRVSKRFDPNVRERFPLFVDNERSKYLNDEISLFERRNFDAALFQMDDFSLAFDANPRPFNDGYKKTTRLINGKFGKQEFRRTDFGSRLLAAEGEECV
jgi:hypothetical protein